MGVQKPLRGPGGAPSRVCSCQGESSWILGSPALWGQLCSRSAGGEALWGAGACSDSGLCPQVSRLERGAVHTRGTLHACSSGSSGLVHLNKSPAGTHGHRPPSDHEQVPGAGTGASGSLPRSRRPWEVLPAGGTGHGLSEGYTPVQGGGPCGGLSSEAERFCLDDSASCWSQDPQSSRAREEGWEVRWPIIHVADTD